MQISRRNILKQTGACLAGMISLGIGSAGAEQRAPRRESGRDDFQRDALLDLNRSMFAVYLYTKFRTSLEPGDQVELELIEVADLPAANYRYHHLPREAERSFSILFLGPHGRRLPQATYRIEHENLGTFLLLLVPVDQHGLFYEAVFNRLSPLDR